MATTTKSKTKKFSDMRRGDQCIHLLLKHGPMTVWELIDKFKTHSVEIKFENLKKVLNLLRQKDKAGVVNYKVESARLKGRDRFDYFRGRYVRNEAYGKPAGGTAYAEVWGAVKE